MIQLQEIFKTLTNVEWKPGITLEQLDFTRVPVTEETPTIASGLRRKKKKKKKKKKVDLATETPMPISGIQVKQFFKRRVVEFYQYSVFFILHFNLFLKLVS